MVTQRPTFDEENQRTQPENAKRLVSKIPHHGRPKMNSSKLMELKVDLEEEDFSSKNGDCVNNRPGISTFELKIRNSKLSLERKLIFLFHFNSFIL